MVEQTTAINLWLEQSLPIIGIHDTEECRAKIYEILVVVEKILESSSSSSSSSSLSSVDVEELTSLLSQNNLPLLPIVDLNQFKLKLMQTMLELAGDEYKYVDGVPL
jgi:hypothetical protein